MRTSVVPHEPTNKQADQQTLDAEADHEQYLKNLSLTRSRRNPPLVEKQ
jgi:hypothetical protein